MEIVVCLKETVDPCSVEFNPLTGEIEEKRLVRTTNPADLCALEMALRLRETWGGSLLALSLGPAEADNTLVLARAMGADETLRIWSDDWDGVTSPQLTAYALSRYIKNRRQPADLILCGDSSGAFQACEVPAWLAEYLGAPLVTGVKEIGINPGQQGVTIMRKLEKGWRQVVLAALPSVLAVGPLANQPRTSPLPDTIAALEAGTPVADLPLATLVRMLPVNVSRQMGCHTQPLRPASHLIFTPDCALPGAERIGQLVSGGMAAKKTAVIAGTPQEGAVAIASLLAEKGVIVKK